MPSYELNMMLHWVEARGRVRRHHYSVCLLDLRVVDLGKRTSRICTSKKRVDIAGNMNGNRFSADSESSGRFSWNGKWWYSYRSRRPFLGIVQIKRIRFLNAFTSLAILGKRWTSTNPHGDLMGPWSVEMRLFGYDACKR